MTPSSICRVSSWSTGLINTDMSVLAEPSIPFVYEASRFSAFTFELMRSSFPGLVATLYWMRNPQ
jgi:hypothetical protein